MYFIRPIAISLFFVWSSVVLANDQSSSQPNVIVIFTDDHGYADLGCYGIMADVKTPNIDQLVENGARMEAGYVTAPLCSPSRCGLISGQYQGKYGMDRNGMLESDPALYSRFYALNNLPKRMQAAGYSTCMAGKSHLGSNNSADLVKLGFDKVLLKNSDRPGHWNMNLEGNDIPPQEQIGGDYHLEMVADFACTFINRFKDEPKFLYLAFRAPHVPLDATKKYLDRFPGEMPAERRKALGALSCIDDGVGEIMETLRKIGQEENTLIFLIGDNGAPLKRMPHEFVTDSQGLKTLKPGTTPVGWDSWDGSLNDPMNGEKGMLLEGGIRTPFIMSWKGTIPGGQVYKNPVISLDVAATAVALAGQPTDPELDGVNLIPYLTGRVSGAPHDVLYWRWSDHYAIRKGDWKYLTVGTWQGLYNIAKDPEEKHELLAQYPEQAKMLHSELEQWTQTLIPAGLSKLKNDKLTKITYPHYTLGELAPKIPPRERDKRKSPRADPRVMPTLPN